MDITVLESFPTSQSGLFSHLTTIVESADKPSLNLSRPSDASPFAAADAKKNLKSKRARPRMLVVINVPVVLGVVLLGLCYLYLLRKHVKRRGNTTNKVLAPLAMESP